MKNNFYWDTGAHNETFLNNHTLPVASWGCWGWDGEAGGVHSLVAGEKW